MAKPPQPLEELLPSVATIVEAIVVKVLHTDAPEPAPRASFGATSTGQRAPRQRIVLEVREVLRGAFEVGQQIEVVKPAAGYALREGNHGPFLLDDGDPPEILGAYGPDSYTLDQIKMGRGC